uniref:Nucleolar and spindle associated protein 1 n=1 Tax=Mola mola TaxID=94237 RepID=A0A3Q4B344_MOLML
MDLDSMKYAELQSLAKELGLKANMKTDKLVKAIKEHYQQEKRKGEGDSEVMKSCSEMLVNYKTVDFCSYFEVYVGISRDERRRRTPTLAKKMEMCPKTEVLRKLKRFSAQRVPRGRSLILQHRPRKEEDLFSSSRYSVFCFGFFFFYFSLVDFKKLHEAHFNKMESIDSYVQRKTKQMETYRSSVKELKKLSDKTKLQQAEGKTQVVSANRASLFSPVPVNKRTAEEKPRRTVLSASKAPNKPARMEDALFRPTVLSTRRMTVRFSEATRDNEYKRSMVKTPARMSSYVTSSTPQKQTSEGTPNNVNNTPFSATKSPGPFVFTGNTSTSTTPGTQKKTKFDLKASLSRPLTYKPHTGKLKPFGDVKENTAADKSLNAVSSHQKNYKQHQVQTRKDRREKLKTDRKQKKENVLGARRGLVMM